MVGSQIRETRYCGVSLVNLHGVQRGQIRETRYCGLSLVNLHGGESDKRDTVLWVVISQPTWSGVR